MTQAAEYKIKFHYIKYPKFQIVVFICLRISAFTNEMKNPPNL